MGGGLGVASPPGGATITSKIVKVPHWEHLSCPEGGAGKVPRAFTCKLGVLTFFLTAVSPIQAVSRGACTLGRGLWPGSLSKKREEGIPRCAARLVCLTSPP